MRGVVNQFFLPFLSHRTQYVSFNNCSSLAYIKIGVPQGSSLGPLFFLLYRNDLPNSVQSTPRLFPGDTCLLISEFTSEKFQIELNKHITSVYNWLYSNKLTVNTSKSQIMIISPKLNSLTPQLTPFFKYVFLMLLMLFSSFLFVFFTKFVQFFVFVFFFTEVFFREMIF